ncbi:YhgE/Pip family protein [Sporosarcina ureae]|uniref:YhgE/Pip family protein n=1 Tax=Sporosarcina ureae TaxID=1571 RepID=UPI0026EBE299|nr:YhgE/Pip family protein [Sporosarcina ureae]
MNKILFIVKRDLRNIFKNKAALIVIAAIAFLPSLYAWMNILASWDPYSNTKGVSVAIVSEDEGAEIEGKEFNVGDEVIVSLTKNDDLGWQFVTKDEALKGVKHGDYYAAIIIPKNFSENLSSIVTDDIKQPTLDYYINEKINAISPKVAGKGASSIVENIDSTFVEQANKAVIKVFNNLGVELENNRVNIEKLRDLVYQLEYDIPDIYSKLQLVDKGLNFADSSIDRVDVVLDDVNAVHANAKKLNARLISKLQENEKTVDNTLRVITSNLESAQTAFRKVPDLTSELSGKGEDVDRIVDSLRDKQGKLEDTNARLDDIYDYLKKQDQNLKDSSNIKDLQSSLSDSVADLSRLKKNLETIISDLQSGKNPATDLITQTQALSDKLAEDMDKIKGNYENILSPQTEKLMKQLKELSVNITSLLDRATEVNTNAQKVVQGLIDKRESIDFSQFQEQLDSMSTAIEDQIAKTDTVISVLEAAGKVTGSDRIASLGQKFVSLREQLVSTKQVIDKVQAAINKGEKPSLELLNQLKGQLEASEQKIVDARNQFDANSQKAITDAIEQLQIFDEGLRDRFNELQASKTEIDEKLAGLLETAEDPKVTIGVLQTMVDRIDNGLSAIGSITSGLTDLEKFIHSDKLSGEIERIKTVQDSLSSANSSVDGLVGRINESKANGKKHLAEVDRVSGELDHSVGEAIDFVNSDLTRKYKSAMRDATNALYDVSDVLDEVNGRIPRLRTALEKAEAGVALGKTDLAKAEKYFPEARETIETMAEKIRKLEEDGDLDRLLDVLATDPTGVSKFFAEPVVLDEHELYPIPNYGSAMSPFYTTLSLWVGALLMVSTLKVDIREKTRFKSYQTYIGRLIIFAGIGTIQSLIVTLGEIFIMNVYVVNKVPFVIFGVIISVVFVTIVYTLVSVFGNTGKVIAIVLMVMQLGASGGTFPIQMAPEFFQRISAFMPFTHAITLLRESIGGIIWAVAWKQILYLFIYFALSLGVGIGLKKFFNKSSDKFIEKAKESNIVM